MELKKSRSKNISSIQFSWFLTLHLINTLRSIIASNISEQTRAVKLPRSILINDRVESVIEISFLPRAIHVDYEA